MVYQKHEPKDRLVGLRLSLKAAVSLCKLAPGRYWEKGIATKEEGSSQFDNVQ